MIEDLIGVPFEEGGRTKSGLDCVGTAMIYMQRRGIPLPDPSKQIGIPVGWGEIPVSEAVRDDVLMLPEHGAEAHLVVVLDQGKALHTSRRIGVHLVSLESAKRRATKAYRYDPRS